MTTRTPTVEALTKLGPCVLALDNHDVVQWASPCLKGLLGVCLVGRTFDGCVAPVDRPLLAFGLRTHNGNTLPLRGDWIPWSAAYTRVFVGSPAPATVEEMGRLGIVLEDFLEKDAWLSYLIQADECAATQKDARERIEQLRQERRKLSRAHDQMRDARRAAFNMLNDLETAKREAELAHAESLQLFEAITSVLIGVDRDGRVTAWNAMAERTFGFGKHDAVGRLFNDLGIEWDRSAVAQGVSKCLAENVTTRVDDVSFTRPDGTNGFLGITLSPLCAGPGDACGFLFVAADITGHKILQGQLAQAQKLESIGQLAAGIAHEINTPIQYVGDNVRFLSDSVDDLLRLIGSFRDILSEVANGGDSEQCACKAAALEQDADLPYMEEELPKAITQSLEGVARVSKIVRAMKEFSHPAAEGKEVADLNKAIESTTTVARNEWKYVANLVTELDASLPPVPCFLGEFNQVILNIVVNAAHAIADVVGDGAAGKGTITVTTRRDGDWAEIRIRDTGSGIPEAHRTKVFDHFFTTKEVGKGTGQGLAIAYAVVTEKHGGTITFETETGKGTTFIIRLPIEPQTTPSEETSEHEEAHSLC